MGSEADLEIRAETPLPARLLAGQPAAIFVCGTYGNRRGSISDVQLLVDGVSHRPSAQGMPRPDAPSGHLGFWGIVPVTDPRPGELRLELSAALADGTSARAPLGSIEVAAPEPPTSGSGGAPLAICMATFDPDPELFRRQIDSLREQTERNWTCLISDDCSPPESFARIEQALSGDERFTVSRSEERLGFYRNFERALEMVPSETELIALCDQDDRWFPEKLATLRAALGDATLVYSDARLVDADGAVLATTMWAGRRNNYENLPSMLITNTITGAASLFRRRVLETALPFPDSPGWEFHDHWLGTVALAEGPVAYVDRPLYDYTQHSGAVLRGLVAQRRGRRFPRIRLPRRAVLRDAPRRWRARYFYGYLPVALRAHVLLARCESRLDGAKRRGLRRLASAERSPLALAWLIARRLRSLVGRTETRGGESVLATGLLWRRLVALCSDRRGRCSAAMPEFHPADLEPRSWRSGEGE